MKRLIFILLILIPTNIYCQGDTIKKKLTGNIGDKTLLTEYELKSGKPTLILVFNNSQIDLDSITIKKIEPNWIRKIVVLKDKKYKTLHGDKNGTILIYPKRKYYNQINEILKK